MNDYLNFILHYYLIHLMQTGLGAFILLLVSVSSPFFLSILTFMSFHNNDINIVEKATLKIMLLID